MIQNGDQIAAVLPDSMGGIVLSHQALKNANVIQWPGDETLITELTTTLGPVDLNMLYTESLRLMKMMNFADAAIVADHSKNQVLGYHEHAWRFSGSSDELKKFMSRQPGGTSQEIGAHIDFLALTQWSKVGADGYRTMVALTANNNREPIIVLLRQKGLLQTVEWISSEGYYFYIDQEALKYSAATIIRKGQFFSLASSKTYTNFGPSTQTEIRTWSMDGNQGVIMAWHDHFPTN